jgi:hypothetical protein
LKSILIACVAALASFIPASAEAGEIFAGLHVHDVKTPLDESGLEKGIDLSLGFRGGQIGKLLGGALQPYFFGAINTAGDTGYAAAGLSARFGLGGGWYVRPAVGLAIHDGSAGKYFRPDRIAFGSRVLLEPEIAIGTRVGQGVSLEASWVHMSHAQLAGKENPGIDNLGVRLNFKL